MLERKIIINPLGPRVLVECTNELSSTSILQMPEDPQKKYAIGVVIRCPKSYVGLKEDEKAVLESLKEGDIIWFSEWSGQSLKGHEQQAIVSTKDIYAIISYEGK